MFILVAKQCAQDPRRRLAIAITSGRRSPPTFFGERHGALAVATLAAGVLCLGASLHGMTKVDTTLKVAAAPTPAPQTEFVRERDCRPERERDRPSKNV